MAIIEGVGLAASLAQTLLSTLQTNRQLRAMCSMFKCESQLEQLEKTMCTIKAVLLDVDQKPQGLTREGQDWVERLKDAVYDIDDLLDEFTTIGHQQNWDTNKFSKKVRGFFSRNNKYFVAFNVSREIKMLREKLEAIAKNHHDYGFKVVSDQVEKRPETWSYISDREVIGREDDKEAIVGMLLSDASHSSNRNVSFVNIVGIGGLGKTALAQLVYNDKRVEQAFSKKIWVCVSEDFGLKQILAKILGNKETTLQQMQREVQILLGSKRYLLVLDDVWNESPEEWLTLKSSLLDMVSNVSGSKIIVTTRSKKVATSIGEKDPTLYELKGLSEENSWKLFKRLAFGENEDEVDLDLVDIGKDIVKKCANVPLSIRVIATMLYKQDKKKWLSFRSIDLAEMCHDQNSIMPTLMFSYYELPTELKCCFSFCSLFPKDHKIKKELLINLWLAQGFLAKTENAGESMEDVGERYFTILLNRNFFQDIEHYDNDVCAFKLHDLMHDLAVQVAGKETFILTPSTTENLGKKIRHLSSYYASPDLCLSNTLRTYIWLGGYVDESWQQLNPVISKCKRLRILSLSDLEIGSRSISILPDKVGRLSHLRYLDLSYNKKLVILPKSITKLYNLQILKLRCCGELKELPKDMIKLVNLRMLDIYGCRSLTHMPRGMNNLKNLQTITQFVVGGIDLNQVQGGKLVDLQGLCLKGDLLIRIRNFSLQYMPCATKRASILKDANLKCLRIEYSEDNEGVEFDQSQVHETLVEDLCPNQDIISFTMGGYRGCKLPSWASMMVSDIDRSQHVTSLSQFRYLKALTLKRLANVEYIEIASEAALASASRGRESMTFFPVLETLRLERMPKLKGWWRGLRWREREAGRGGCLVDADGLEYAAESLPCFPRLRVLEIHHCNSMTYFPPCPHLKRLTLQVVDEALTFRMKGGASSSNTPASSLLCLEELGINDARVMNSVLREFVGVAVDLTLGDHKMKSMGILRERFERCGKFLRKLEISHCWVLDMEEEGMPWKYLQSLTSLKLWRLPKMVKLPEGFKYLTSLQSLIIESCDNLEEVGRCISFLTSLHSLEFQLCSKLKALPECIGSLTSLQFLRIDSTELKSFPESMCHLTSLTTLVVLCPCDELRKRCQEKDGEDWPKICHIPNLKFINTYGKLISLSSALQNELVSITTRNGTIN